MAFGSLKIFPVKHTQKEPEMPKEEIPVQVNKEGIFYMRASVVAASVAEATDFLCGLYFNISRELSGTAVAGFTKYYETICRLTELKRDLEAATRKPVGTAVKRTVPDAKDPLMHCIYSLGQSGNKTTTMELEMRCDTAPKGGDVVIALLNSRNPQSAQRVKDAVAGVSCPVIWVICGFENERFYLEHETHPVLEVTFSNQLINQLGITPKRGDIISFAQIYGGLQFAAMEADGSVTMQTWKKCRDYCPVGCHVGILQAISTGLKQQESLTPAMVKLQDTLRTVLSHWSNWYGQYGEKEGGTS